MRVLLVKENEVLGENHYFFNVTDKFYHIRLYLVQFVTAGVKFKNLIRNMQRLHL